MHHAMSKNVEFWPFVIMKTIIILIVIFNFIQSVYCNDTDNTIDPLYISRPKRAFEYTRWKVLDDDPEKQFIVKVFDDDVATPSRSGVVGVNYPTQAPAPGNLIVSGVVVSPGHPPSEPSSSMNEYIRFLPPHRTGDSNDELSGENYTLPRAIDQWNLSPKMPEPYPEREEIPPASPQFLPRANLKPSLQYVPVVSVSSQTKNSDDDNTEDPLVIFKPKKMISVTKVAKPDRAYNRIPSRMLHITRTISRTAKIETKDEYLIEHRKSTEKTNLLEDNYFDLLRMKNELTEKSPTYHDIPTRLRVKDKEVDYNSESKKDNQISENIVDTNKIFLSLDYNYETNDKEPSNSGNDEFKPVFSDDSNAIHDNKQSKKFKLDSILLGADYEEESTEYNEKNVTRTNEETLKSVTVLPSGNIRRAKSVDICNILNIRPLRFNDTLTLPEITQILKSWIDRSPITKSVDITYGNLTTMENPIPLIIVDDPSGGQSLSAKKTVMIVAGIIGRDHYSVSAAMYVLHQLIDKTEKHQDLLNAYRFWIIPVFNPDGYDYSKSFPQYRNWKKNLRQNWEYCKGEKTEMESCKTCEMFGLRCFIQPCYGVNLDRNFEYQWIPGHEIEMEHPCGDLYSSQQQLSEVETFALTDYLHKSTVHIDSFIAIKEGDVLGIMYPYSHTKKKRPREGHFRAQASAAVNAIYQLTGRIYQAGQTSEFLPLFAGGIEDWVDGHLALDNTYSIHMYRKADLYNALFSIPIEKLVQESFVALESLLIQKPSKPISIVTAARAGPKVTSTAPSVVAKQIIIQQNKSHTHPPWIVLVVASIIISLK